ncbi:TonB-dependent receptor [Prolixibacteraceae bacterium JC049]|nr:TonB-dependent receptor [Prolixibacteraceae bacterium JC049]
MSFIPLSWRLNDCFCWHKVVHLFLEKKIELKRIEMSKRITWVLVILIWSCTASWANPGGAKRKLLGKVLEKGSAHPIEYATIAVFKNDKLITGGVSGVDGTFLLELKEPEVDVKVSFMGYESVTIKQVKINKGQFNLGEIFLKNTQSQLQDVVVRAEKSKTVFKLDKKVFNVGKDLTSAGGTAMDILNNVPSVDVSIEGTISLRGNSSVQILINGKPSVMASSKTLGTITADMIEKVEVVTNPSAKFDAEGRNGIINIILKKNEKKGLNGAITANVGTPDNHSVGLSLNRRTEKWNLFTQMGVGYRTFLSESYSKNINRIAEQQPQIIANGEAEKNEQFYNFILGADYHINKWQTISLSGHYGYEAEDENSTTNYEQSTLESSTVNRFLRKEETESTNPKWQYELNYKKEFEDNKKRSLTASATGSYFGKDKSSVFTNSGTLANSVLNNEKVDNDFYDAEYNFQADYVHPFTEETTFEGGLKYNINVAQTDLDRFAQVDDNWQLDANQSNRFNYQRNIAAAYSTYAYENKRWGIKIGLRVEHEYTNSYLENSPKKKSNNTHLFPSLHSSLKFDNEFSLQLGYSRRIRRPHLWHLNPFLSYRDPLNISKGNSELEPGLSNAIEFTAIKVFKNGSLNGSLFYTENNNEIERITELNGNVRTTMPMNVGKSKDKGVEINGKWEPLKWLSFLMEGNYTGYTRTGQYKDQNFDFSSSYWSARFTTKFKLPYDIDIEYRHRYRSKYKGLQSTSSAVSYADFGIRKQLLKKKAVLHLSVKDVFNTRKHENETDLPSFYSFNTSQHSKRIIVLGLSFGFGKGETMEYSGMKMF